jgi:hypothetical protein
LHEKQKEIYTQKHARTNRFALLMKLFAVDLNLEFKRFELLKKLIKRFIVQKYQLKPRLIGILVLTESTVWHLPFTMDQSTLFYAIDSLHSRSCEDSFGKCD